MLLRVARRDADRSERHSLRRRRIPVIATASLIASYVDLMRKCQPPYTGLLADLAVVALSRVDWTEVVAALLEDEVAG